MNTKDHDIKKNPNLLSKLVQKICKSKKLDSDHHVAPKQEILPHSPEKEQQLDFIDEGGNSQPLKK